MQWMPILLMAALYVTAPKDGPVPLVTFPLQTTAQAGQSFSFTSQARPPKPIIATGADKQTLFALVPLRHRVWELQRLQGWSGTQPVIERLSIDGDDSDAKLDSTFPQMSFAPDNALLYIRLHILDLKTFARRCVVVTVDLHQYKVVSRALSTDPLVANARWRFNDDGELLSATGTQPVVAGHSKWPNIYVSHDEFSMNGATEGAHEAAVLALPSLTPKKRCTYEIGRRPTNVDEDTEDDSDDTPNVDIRGHSLSPWMMTNSRNLMATGKSGDCADVLKVASDTSLADVVAVQVAGVSVRQRLGTNCEAQDGDGTASLALFRCHLGFALNANAFVTVSGWEQVVSTKSDGSILRVRLKANEDDSSALGRANGREYLILLRDKLRVEVYELSNGKS